MAVPKRRTSKAKSRMRRAANMRCDFVARPQACESCGEPKMSHRVCPSCGRHGETFWAHRSFRMLAVSPKCLTVSAPLVANTDPAK